MNVIFLTMVHIDTIMRRGIYEDLLRRFVSLGHGVYIVFPSERRLGKRTSVYDADGAHFLGVRTLNLQKSSIIEKGAGQVLVESQFKRSIKKFWKDENFDLILYSTPPITLIGTILYLRVNNPQSKTYLLLKDIFPQNAVDIGMMTKHGLKGVLYRFFRNKEKKLYAISDHIGCMSPANVDYLLKHNLEIAINRVEVAPNSIELQDVKYDERQEKAERYYIKRKYDLPADRPIFVYGGNLGKPQGISFLIDCLEANKNRRDCYFVIVGNGTEYQQLEHWYRNNLDRNVILMQGLPKEEYDMLIKHCDAGLIFLDHRFTIPNYPSRLLSYLENKMPVLCATDPNTDIGKQAVCNGFGYWCESDSVDDFTVILDKMINSDRKAMGEKGYEFLIKNYLVENTYNAIMSHV